MVRIGFVGFWNLLMVFQTTKRLVYFCFLLDAAWVSRLPRNKHTDHVTMFDLGFFRSNLSCAKKWCPKVPDGNSGWWFRSSGLPCCLFVPWGCMYLFRWFFIINIHVPTDWCGSSAWKVPCFFPSSWEGADDCDFMTHLKNRSTVRKGWDEVIYWIY